jgi:tryptophan synthase alpha chain
MNRIDELFGRKGKSVLSVYFTAGYPEIGDTAAVLTGLEKAGADLVEIGFPFSDPVADGPVIQASSHQALENGMNLDILFSQLKGVKESSRIPKIMMGYFNTVYQYGVQRFIDQCVASGIAGTIIPDLPPEVYESEYKQLFETAGIHFICLAAPKTTPARLLYLSSLSRGFLYILSSSSTTGSSALEALRSLGTIESPLPTLIGFGIHDHETFELACTKANGAIIGTAFIRELKGSIDNRVNPASREQTIHNYCMEFLRSIRG